MLMFTRETLSAWLVNRSSYLNIKPNLSCSFLMNFSVQTDTALLTEHKDFNLCFMSSDFEHHPAKEKRKAKQKAPTAEVPCDHISRLFIKTS